MTDCTNEAHYPQPVSPGELDAHLHAAGRVELVDGVPAVVEPSDCSRKWRTLIVDPPWNYTQHWKRKDAWSPNGRMFKRGVERGAATQYDCMSLAEIAALPVGEWAEPDAHIYVWTTNAFLEATFPLLKAWGFSYKTMLTWQKPQIGMGMYFRNSTEHVLFGVRGRLKLLRRDVPTHFTANRARHSEKPSAFYDLIQTCSPGPFLDVFARKHRFGFDVAGNEVYSAIPELAYQPPHEPDTAPPQADDAQGGSA